jgi:N-acetylneuraminic acid mutarotase
MLVWGGQNTGPTNTGGRYDPDLNIWSPMTTVGSPSGRYEHSTIWTGDMLVVWGGTDEVTVGGLESGGRYDPQNDTWTPTGVSPAPSDRHRHTAVWTGNQMIVWGGANNASSLGTGSRYDPATDSWSATAIAGAPSARERHTAVWTGSKMIVWGGASAGGNVNEGARYDPLTDTWSPTATTGAPSARSNHVAVWSGNRMIVWGGGATTGGRYNPVTDTWAPTTMTGAPAGSLGSAVWTGSEMIVWGGDTDIAYVNAGGRYNPVTDSWLSTATTGAPTGRNRHIAAWAGGRMVVWGGFGLNIGIGETEPLRDGGRYDPVTNTWAPVSSVGAPSERFRPTAVSTGSRVIVWGGDNASTVLRSGGRYDPATDTWLPTSLLNGVPYIRSGHTAVWTGDAMIVWGGKGKASYLKSGGRYLLGASEDNDGDGASGGFCDTEGATEQRLRRACLPYERLLGPAGQVLGRKPEAIRARRRRLSATLMRSFRAAS